MKVRFRSGSLRLRLAPQELESLQRGEPVREVLAFPGGASWTVAIEPHRGPTSIRGEANAARLALSRDDVTRLSAPDTEGVYFHAEGDAGEGELRYFIEKDFPCLHPRPAAAAEPDDDTFDAPPDFAARHCRPTS